MFPKVLPVPISGLLSTTGLQVNAVRVFENACSGSVLCSMFDSERVREQCSALNVFGFLGGNVVFSVWLSVLCCVRCRVVMRFDVLWCGVVCVVCCVLVF